MISRKFNRQNLGTQKATVLPKDNPSWLRRISPDLHFIWKISWNAGLRSESRILYSHVLVLPLLGSGAITIKEKTFPLRAGQFFIIPPGQWHSFEIGKRGLKSLLAHFSWVHADKPDGWKLSTVPVNEYDKKLLLPSPAWIPGTLLSGRVSPPARKSFLRMWDLWKNGRGESTLVPRAALLETLTTLLTPWFDQPEKPAPHLIHLMEEILSRKDLKESSIQKTLSQTGFSYAHLARTFKKHHHLTPGQYWMHNKMNTAKELLAEGKVAIYRVAEICGFEDAAYFSKVFRKHFGIAPGQSRELKSIKE